MTSDTPQQDRPSAPKRRFGWYSGDFDSPTLHALMDYTGWHLTARGLYFGQRGIFWIRRTRKERA